MAQRGLNPVGRPTKIVDAVEKLEEVFRLDVTDVVACNYAGIHRDTFYKWMATNKEFSDRINEAKQYAYLAAKSVVASDITNKSSKSRVETAKWWLEKKHGSEFKSNNKMELTGEDGGPVQHQILAGIGFLPPKEVLDGSQTVSGPEKDDATPGGGTVAGCTPLQSPNMAPESPEDNNSDK